MPETIITVFIYLPGETTAVPAGRFTHSSELGIGTFDYGQRYLKRPNALPVDPVALPLGVRPKEANVNEGLYGAFRDAAPDFWGRLVISYEMGVPPESISEIDYLLATNATRVGNLDFRNSPGETEPELNPPHFNQLHDIMEASIKIQSGEKIEKHLIHLLRQGTSMGGARPKCTVEWDNELWIAKFSGKGDSLNFPQIEYATIKLAARCGILTPEVQVVSVEGRDVFLTRRFDRKKSEKGWLRHGFISALSLMQWDELDRVKWDYPSIADMMRRYVSADDIRELYRRMVFNIMVRNTDDHPRNHGFLVQGDKISLSPAYDIVPSIARPGVGTTFDLAMGIGDEGRKANLKNAISRCGRFGLSKQETIQIINELKEVVSKWKEHFNKHGVSEKDIDALIPSFMIHGEFADIRL